MLRISAAIALILSVVSCVQCAALSGNSTLLSFMGTGGRHGSASVTPVNITTSQNATRLNVQLPQMNITLPLNESEFFVLFPAPTPTPTLAPTETLVFELSLTEVNGDLDDMPYFYNKH